MKLLTKLKLRAIWQICGYFALLFLVACGQLGHSPDVDLNEFIEASDFQVQTNERSLHIPKYFGLPNNLHFEGISVEAGLSQSTVTSIIQDGIGYMWFGTQDGLNRYDGQSFEIFRTDKTNENSLSSNIITVLAPEKSGGIWVGTRTGGLNLFHPETNSFSRYMHDYEDPASIGSDFVIDVAQMSDEELWVLLDSGVDRFNPATQEFNHVPFIHGNPVELGLSVIYIGADGQVWVGAEDGLYKYDPEEGAFVEYKIHGFSLIGITDILEDEDKNMWVGTYSSGLYRFNLDQDSVDIFRDGDSGAKGHFGQVYALFEDAAGEIWVGTGYGLGLFDEIAVKFVFYQHASTGTFSLSDNRVLSIFQDREANLWIGTALGGINKLVMKNAVFSHFTVNDPYSSGDANNVIWDVMTDSNGNLWVGTEDSGAFVFDANGKFISHFSTISSKPYLLTDNHVKTLMEDDLGNIWIGTYDGVFVYSPSANTLRHYSNDFRSILSLSNNVCLKIFQDSKQRIWIGTYSGLNYYDPDIDGFIRYFHDPNDPASLSDNYVGVIIESHNGALWLGTNNGITWFDPEEKDFIQYPFTQNTPLQSNRVLSLYEDENSILWVGTEQDGLHRIRLQDGQINHFTVEDGLPNNVVYGIIPDNEGNLWLSTNFGISRFDPQTETFRNFDVRVGLQSNEFNFGASNKTEDGWIMFGGVNGVTIFDPADLHLNTQKPPVVITSLTQGGEEIEGNDNLENLSEVVLAWPNNYFEFNFSILSYIEPDNNQYAYYLQDFDERPVMLENKGQGRYTNLPGGTYTLVLFGANADGIWNTEGKRIVIRVNPPIWESPIFQGAVLLLAVLLGFGVYRFRVRRVETQNQRLSDMVNERTKELLNINERLEIEITERKKAEMELAKRAADEAVVAERTRLAQELHDSVSQTLFSAALIADVLPRMFDRDIDKAMERLAALQDLTRSAQTEMRTLLLELHPIVLSETPIDELILQLIDSINRRSQMHVFTNISAECELPPEVKIAFYRIIQESLNNVIKHAKTDAVEVAFYCKDGSAKCVIQDHGIGFRIDEVSPERMGVSIMKERAESVDANLTVISEPGAGTKISCEWKAGQGDFNE